MVLGDEGEEMTDPILARAFAVSNDTEQAELINSVARELFVVCGGRFRKESQYGAGYESQCCMISAKLNKDGSQLIKDLYGFIQLRERDMS